MYNEFSNPLLTDVNFSDNAADQGGGIYNLTSSPTLVDVTSSTTTLATSAAGGQRHPKQPDADQHPIHQQHLRFGRRRDVELELGRFRRRHPWPDAGQRRLYWQHR